MQNLPRNANQQHRKGIELRRISQTTHTKRLLATRSDTAEFSQHGLKEWFVAEPTNATDGIVQQLSCRQFHHLGLLKSETGEKTGTKARGKAEREPARPKMNSKETLKNSWPPKKQIGMLSKEVAETVWQANQSGCKKADYLDRDLLYVLLALKNCQFQKVCHESTKMWAERR